MAHAPALVATSTARTRNSMVPDGRRSGSWPVGRRDVSRRTRSSVRSCVLAVPRLFCELVAGDAGAAGVGCRSSVTVTGMAVPNRATPVRGVTVGRSSSGGCVTRRRGRRGRRRDGGGVGVDGVGVGATVGIGVGVGATVGTGVGVGATSGWGSASGRRSGGVGVGATVGTGVGATVGTGVGASVGTGVGAGVGTGVGATVGTGVGAAVGTGVGAGRDRGRGRRDRRVDQADAGRRQAGPWATMEPFRCRRPCWSRPARPAGLRVRVDLREVRDAVAVGVRVEPRWPRWPCVTCRRAGPATRTR